MGALLDHSEKLLLTTLEEVVRQGLESFVEVGNALATIRDKELYRSEFKTFEEYCGKRWQMKRTYAFYLINSAEVVSDVHNCERLPETESQARPLVAVPREERAEVWQQVVETAPKDDEGAPVITAKHVQQVVDEVRQVERKPEPEAPKPHVANNSGNNEWYTPPEIIDAARKALGRIDCDPASSEAANSVVKAGRYFTAESCGLSAERWGERVWMNPPYAQPLCSQFCESLVTRFKGGDVCEACVLVNNATETAWFTTLARHATAVCFLEGRVKFLDATLTPKNTPLQGQAVLYFGARAERFFDAFRDLGWGALTQ